MTILGHKSYGILAPTFTIIYNVTLMNSIFSLVHIYIYIYIYIYIASENALQRQTMPAEQAIHKKTYSMVVDFVLVQVLVMVCADTWWCCWLRHCATSRKVAGLIPDDAT